MLSASSIGTWPRRAGTQPIANSTRWRPRAGCWASIRIWGHAAVSLTLVCANGASFSFPGLSTSTFYFTNWPVATSCCAGRCAGSVICPGDCSKLLGRSKPLPHHRAGCVSLRRPIQTISLCGDDPAPDQAERASALTGANRLLQRHDILMDRPLSAYGLDSFRAANYLTPGGRRSLTPLVT